MIEVEVVVHLGILKEVQYAQVKGSSPSITQVLGDFGAYSLIKDFIPIIAEAGVPYVKNSEEWILVL